MLLPYTFCNDVLSFRRAELADKVLDFIDLRDSDLRQADLANADLSYSQLKRGRLAGS